MIELEKHIEILLLKNDCVIVPGLGGFTASHVPARYDKVDNIFVPPLRTLGFNSKLNINDSLLAQSYAEAYDISYPEALRRISDEIAELKQSLNNDGFFSLNDVGTLYLNENDSISFKPCEAGILTPELYSLSSFDMCKLSNETLKAESAKEKSMTGQAIGILNVDTTPMSNRSTTTVNDAVEKYLSNERKTRIKFSVLRNLAALLIAIVAFFAMSSPINNSDKIIQMSQLNYGLISHLIIDYGKETLTSESVSNKPNRIMHVKQAKIDNVPHTADVTVPKANISYYSIVLASRVTKKNAEAYVKHLALKGFNKARVLTEAKKSIKVIYGHYTTDNEAYNALNDLVDNEFFYDAWIYKVKE